MESKEFRQKSYSNFHVDIDIEIKETSKFITEDNYDIKPNDLKTKNTFNENDDVKTDDSIFIVDEFQNIRTAFKEFQSEIQSCNKLQQEFNINYFKGFEENRTVHFENKVNNNEHCQLDTQASPVGISDSVKYFKNTTVTQNINLASKDGNSDVANPKNELDIVEITLNDILVESSSEVESDEDVCHLEGRQINNSESHSINADIGNIEDANLTNSLDSEIINKE